MDKRKDYNIEYIRAISAIAVVSIHTVYSGILYSTTQIESAVLFFTCIKNLLYWAVPCFCMITGYLLLNPSKELSIKKIYSEYLLRALEILLLFGTAFSWMEIIFNERCIRIGQLLEAFICVVNNNTWAHLWYMYAIIPIYLLLPFWRIIIKKSDNRALIVILTAVLMLSLITQSREISLQMYFLLGEVYRRRLFTLKKLNAGILTGVFSLAIIIAVLLQEKFGYNLDFLFGYQSILVIFQSYLIFNQLRSMNIRSKYIKSYFLKIADKSFGIYLIHMIFVNFEYKVFKLNLTGKDNTVFLLLILITINVIASYMCTWILKKLPIINRII